MLLCCSIVTNQQWTLSTCADITVFVWSLSPESVLSSTNITSSTGILGQSLFLDKLLLRWFRATSRLLRNAISSRLLSCSVLAHLLSYLVLKRCFRFLNGSIHLAGRGSAMVMRELLIGLLDQPSGKADPWMVVRMLEWKHRRLISYLSSVTSDSLQELSIRLESRLMLETR